MGTWRRVCLFVLRLRALQVRFASISVLFIIHILLLYCSGPIPRFPKDKLLNHLLPAARTSPVFIECEGKQLRSLNLPLVVESDGAPGDPFTALIVHRAHKRPTCSDLGGTTSRRGVSPSSSEGGEEHSSKVVTRWNVPLFLFFAVLLVSWNLLFLSFIIFRCYWLY